MHTGQSPSPWVERFVGLIPAGGRVLDLACGAGRHSRLLLRQSFEVLAVDRDISRIADISSATGLDALEIDLENGTIPDFFQHGFDGIVVTDYLHRPLLEPLRDALNRNGILIYETFAQGNEVYGRPSRADFLLAPGELLRLVDGHCQVIAFEQGLDQEPRQAVRQRICAMKGSDIQAL